MNSSIETDSITIGIELCKILHIFENIKMNITIDKYKKGDNIKSSLIFISYCLFQFLANFAEV